MSTYVWMRVLESASHRYDFGIRLLSLGRIERVYDRVAELARGPEVLDLGCGTGNVTLRLARRGLRVTGIDLSPDMLEVARQKPVRDASVRWICAGAVELIDHFERESFDTIVAVLLLSELSSAEQAESLRQCHRLLRPRGQLLLADEVRPPTFARRALHGALRLPLAALTFVLTQTSTEALHDLDAKLDAAHFAIVRRESNRLEDFVILEAEKQEVPRAVAG